MKKAEIITIRITERQMNILKETQKKMEKGGVQPSISLIMRTLIETLPVNYHICEFLDSPEHNEYLEWFYEQQRKNNAN